MTRVAVAAVAAVSVSAGVTACSSSGGTGTYRLTAVFPKTISLYPSSDVRVLGLPAGKVRSVRVFEGERVRVVMDIKKSVPVPADVHATIVPQSLIGERYVQLSPVWTQGAPRAPGGTVIPLERTDIPVEPDEALAALKKFLDSLDPNATGRLVSNAAADLQGNGQTLNSALDATSNLVATLAAKDDDIGKIIDNFDQFTATLDTREAELGRTLQLFATTTDLLAQERHAIEGLVSNLAGVANNTLDLVSEHRARLDADLTTLTHVLQSVNVNISTVDQLLQSGALVAKGTQAAYSKDYHRIDLRDAISPDLAQALIALHVPAGNIACVPVTVACPPGTAAAAAPASRARNRRPTPTSAPTTAVDPPAPATPPAGAAPDTASAAPPPSPVDAIVGLLGGPAAPSPRRPASVDTSEHLVSAAGRAGGFLRRLTRVLLGESA